MSHPAIDECYTFIYVISPFENGEPVKPCKIGITNKPLARLSGIQTGNPKKLDIVCAIPIPSKQFVGVIERTMHALFEDHRLNGEWFDLCPVEVSVSVCTVIHEMFMQASKDDSKVYKVLDNLGVTAVIKAMLERLDCRAGLN